MKSPTIIAKLSFLSLFSILLPFSVSAQDGTQGGSGGESAAESSVTTSSSKKAAVLPEAVESNPVVTIIRSGLSVAQIRGALTNLNKADLRSITRSGSKNDLKAVASSYSAGNADLDDIRDVVKNGGDSQTALNRSEGVKIIENKFAEDLSTLGLSDDELNQYQADLVEALKNPNASVDKDSAISRTNSIDNIKTKLSSDSTNFNTTLAASFFAAISDTTKEISEEDITTRVDETIKIISNAGGIDAASENILSLAANAASSENISDLEERATEITKIEAQGLTGSAVNDLLAKLTNPNLVDESGSSPAIDDLVNQTNDIIVYAASTGSTEVKNEDVSSDDSDNGGNTGSSAGGDTPDVDLGDYDWTDPKISQKITFVTKSVTGGLDQAKAEEVFDVYGDIDILKDKLSLTLTSDADYSKLANVLNLGFDIEDLEETDFDYDFYSAAYATEGGDSFSGGLNIDQAKEAKSLGYEISELNNLSKLVNNLENDDSYTVGSLAGKDLALIVEALELDSADFSQSDALAIGGSSYTSQDLDSINTLKNSVTYHALTGTPLDDEGSFDYSITSLNVDPITVNEILGFTPSQISSLLSYDDPGVSYALFRTLQNFSSESDIDTNLEGIGQLVSDVLANRSSFNDAPAYNADDILNKSYIDELAYFLDNYNILGQNGSELLSFINNGNSIAKENYLSGYIKYLAAYTGSRTFGDDFDTAVADIPLDNVTLLPGANFTLSGDHDVSSLIEPATLTNNNVDSDDIKILVAGAAKDFTITGDLTIHNVNKVEDHALVLAAADDFYLRSEYSSENSEDYDDPEAINIKYTGSNLAIASQDTMVLVNANITTGGNLAIGTLDELHIGLSDNHHSIITLGEGGNSPSPDNLYLYANDLISVNGLDIEGYVSKVYMEAHTLALRDVMFPAMSRVMLRAKTGELNFNPTPITGYVNLYESGHESIRGGADLVRSDFEGSIGHYNSKAKHPNGEPYISVRAQQAN